MPNSVAKIRKIPTADMANQRVLKFLVHLGKIIEFYLKIMFWQTFTLIKP